MLGPVSAFAVRTTAYGSPMAGHRGTAAASLSLTRDAILGHRRRVGGLVDRMPRRGDTVRAAAAVGLTDSVPRAAVLSLHARLHDVPSDILDDPGLTQVWGPRYSVYVVAADDVAPFTLGRLPVDARGRARAQDIAARLATLVADTGPITMGAAGRAIGIHHNALRYASPTGTVRIRWDGARQPTVTVVDPPALDARGARLELVRRYLHHLGPATVEAFTSWAGIRPRPAAVTFNDLHDELLPVRTPVGEAWILAADEPSFRTAAGHASGVRLLPSGDAYWLLWGRARDLLVGSREQRDSLWTSRVWPGAVLLDGEIVGTWRRAGAVATVSQWRRLTAAQRSAIEEEAASMPLPDLATPVAVSWT